MNIVFVSSAILHAVSASRPRAEVAYCIHGLAKRLSKAHSWKVYGPSEHLVAVFLLILWGLVHQASVSSILDLLYYCIF